MNSDAASLFSAPLGRDHGPARIKARSGQKNVQKELRDVIDYSPLVASSSSDIEGSERVTGPSDEALMALLGAGNGEALSILFRRYARLVRSVAYRILRDSSEADDLLQDVFLFIFRKAALFDHERGPARSWLVQVTYHRAIDRRRHLISRHFYSHLGLEDPAVRSPESSSLVDFYERSIEGVLGKAVLERINECLSENQRRTIQLYFFEGYSLEEIANESGQPVGNIRNHYYRGLEKMREIVFNTNLREK